MNASITTSGVSNTSLFSLKEDENEDLFSMNNSTLPRNSSDTEAMVVGIINTLLGVAIFLGNCFVIVAITKTRTLKSCVGLIVLNMAVADLTTGVSLMAVSPFSLPGVRPCLHSLMALVVFVCRTISYTSVFSLVLVTLDRWIAITRPSRYTSLVTKKTIKGCVVGCWCLALFISGLGFLSSKYYIFASDTVSMELGFIHSGSDLIYIYSSVHLFHCLTIIFCGAQIARELRKTRRVINTAYGQSKLLPYFKQQVKFTEVLFIILLIHVVSTYPYLLYTLILQADAAGGVLSLAGATVMYSNSILRVLLYMVLVTPIRKAVLTLLRKEKTRRNPFELFIVSPSMIRRKSQ